VSFSFERMLGVTLPGSPGGTRKRILALDGGGVRGVLSIEILARMEELLREHHGKPDLVLADHFQFIAGTSAGAIVAALLSWGDPVDTVRELFLERSAEIFSRAPLWKVWRLGRLLRAFYESQALSRFLQEHFHDEATGKPALLRTSKLKTMLMLCMRNASTGSAWPITNNPAAKFNQGDPGDDPMLCNMNIPLWQLVRASTAAPVYFLPEHIAMDKATAFEFMDGATTAYNNPALIAVLTATLPCYHMGWPADRERLHMVSVGTGGTRSVLKDRSWAAYNIATNLRNVPLGLIENITVQQDYLCRVLGDCIFGEEIDGEAGCLSDCGEVAGGRKQFSYVRYDHRFLKEEIEGAKRRYGGGFDIDNLRMIPYLTEVGRGYAERNVRVEHLL